MFLTDVNEANLAFTYTPNSGFCGIDSFMYTIEHYADNPADPQSEIPDWVTSNTGTITL